jgi:hypothetical protein
VVLRTYTCVCFRYRGREVAIKTVNLNGHDIQECQEKQKPVSAAASLPVCYRRAAAKILKELILLTELAHSNIVEVWHFMTWLYLSGYFSPTAHTVIFRYKAGKENLKTHHKVSPHLSPEKIPRFTKHLNTGCIVVADEVAY